MRGPDRIWAKKPANPSKPRCHELLPGHTQAVLNAATRILDHCGQKALEAAGLPDSAADRLRKAVLLGSFLHDLGKANSEFQAMLRGERQSPQFVRHEAISLWLAWRDGMLHKWLSECVRDEHVYLLALLAAAGHHRKFPDHALAPSEEAQGTHVVVFAGHPDFRAAAESGQKALSLSDPPPLNDCQISRRDIENWLVQCEDEANRCLRESSELDRRLLALTKAFVIAADLAGSVLPRAQEHFQWIESALSERDRKDIFEKIIDQRLNAKSPYPFQEALGAANAPVTIAIAGCASGKTIGAYIWALRQHGRRRLWFTYPTTGTATEGYRGYLMDPHLAARLEHSRARVDLELLGANQDESPEEAADRLEAIRVWECDVVACTVDTLLGLLQNQRRGLYAFPAICDAAVVFDEVHAYDDRMFALMLRFLEDLPGIPALLMTASMPQERLDAIRNVCRQVHRCEPAIVRGEERLEQLPRYRRRVVRDPWSAVQECLEANEKVLWISNRVDACIQVWDQARKRGIPALAYHSRFRYVDRVRRHEDVIRAFDRNRRGAAFATTTQVAEMSLDISADLLIMELAPIPAMIQRLGRLNRWPDPDHPQTKPFIVIEPPRPEPYEPSELREAKKWIEALGQEKLSQRDLVTKWRTRGRTRPKPHGSAWLDGGFRTVPGEVREIDYGITIILEQDRREAESSPDGVVRYAIPMPAPPRGMDWQRWPRIRGVPVAPDGVVEYDAERGARWNGGAGCR